jgi:hypothetical protein
METVWLMTGHNICCVVQQTGAHISVVCCSRLVHIYLLCAAADWCTYIKPASKFCLNSVNSFQCTKPIEENKNSYKCYFFTHPAVVSSDVSNWQLATRKPCIMKRTTRLTCEFVKCDYFCFWKRGNYFFK